MKIFWDICLFRRGPDALPYGISLLIIIGLINYLFVLTGIWGTGAGVVAVLKGAALILSVLLFVYILLRARGVSERFVQTGCAVLGTSAIVSFCSLPFVLLSWGLQSVGYGGSQGVYTVLFVLVLSLYMWSVAIDGWIFSAAMNISRGFGLFWAVLVELVNIVLFNYFF